MMYELRLVHHETHCVAYLSIEAADADHARRAAWAELLRKGFAEPTPRAWSIFAVIERLSGR